MKEFLIADFAALPSAYLADVDSNATLLARIHPNCKRRYGDDDVLERALVFLPADESRASCLGRFTIREKDVFIRPSSDFKNELSEKIALELVLIYRELRNKIEGLPTIEMTHGKNAR